MAATVKVGKNVQLGHDEQCGTCGLTAPRKKACTWCGNEWPDWPRDERAYLEEHGWTFVPSYNLDGSRGPDGQWQESLAMASGLVTEDMIRNAKGRVSTASLVSVNKGVLRDDGSHPSRDGQYVPRSQQSKETLAKVQGMLDTLLAAQASKTLVQVRAQECFDMQEAVRMQLVSGRRYRAERRHQRRTHPDSVIEDYRRRMKHQRGGHLTRDDEMQLARMTKKETTVHEAMCVGCHRYPSDVARS